MKQFIYTLCLLASLAIACQPKKRYGSSTITGSVSIQSAEDLYYYNHLEKITGDLDIWNNNYTQINAFNKLTTVTGNIKIKNNDKLTAIGGFDKLQTAGSITIGNNDQLTTIPTTLIR